VLVTYLVSTSSALSYAVGEWARVWALQSLIRPADLWPRTSWPSTGRQGNGFGKHETNKNWTLKGAFYEFQWPAVIDAFREAKQRKVTVSIVFDDIKNATGPRKKNEKAIAAERLKSVCIPRTNGTLMHNNSGDSFPHVQGVCARGVCFSHRILPWL
jgi:hypothetical protein